MGNYEKQPIRQSKEFKGTYATIVVTDMAKIQDLLDGSHQTPSTPLMLSPTILPPPLKQLSLEVYSATTETDGTTAAADALPPSLYGFMTFPEVHNQAKEAIVTEIVHHFNKSGLEAHQMRSTTEQGISQYDFVVDDTQHLEIMTWSEGLSLRAFKDDAIATPNTVHNFFVASVGAIDALAQHCPVELSQDDLSTIHVMPPQGKEVAVINDRVELPDSQLSCGMLDDIGGLTTAKERLADIGLAWTYPDLADEYDVTPSHFILAGPPGTGKTSLVNAFGNQFGALVINKKSSDIIDKYVGNSAKQLSAVFAEALTAAKDTKVVLFFDEIDSLLSTKNGEGGGERSDVRNGFKQEIDAIAHAPHGHNLVVAGATNSDIANLDAAVMRAGRIEAIPAPVPNEMERRDIWLKLVEPTHAIDAEIDAVEFIKDDFHTGTRTTAHGNFDDSVSPIKLAELTEGLTGADFADIIKRVRKLKFRRAAGMAATRQIIDFTTDPSLKLITQAEIEQQIQRYGR